MLAPVGLLEQGEPAARHRLADDLLERSLQPAPDALASGANRFAAKVLFWVVILLRNHVWRPFGGAEATKGPARRFPPNAYQGLTPQPAKAAATLGSIIVAAERSACPADVCPLRSLARPRP